MNSASTIDPPSSIIPPEPPSSSQPPRYSSFSQQYHQNSRGTSPTQEISHLKHYQSQSTQGIDNLPPGISLIPEYSDQDSSDNSDSDRDNNNDYADNSNNDNTNFSQFYQQSQSDQQYYEPDEQLEESDNPDQHELQQTQMRQQGAISYIGHPNSSINALALIEGTTFFLTGGGSDGLVKLNQISDDENQGLITFPRKHSKSTSINYIDYDSMGQTFISCDGNGVIMQYDVTKQMSIRQLPNYHKRYPLFCNKYLNKDLVASCGASSRLKIYDLRQFTRQSILFDEIIGRDILSSCDFNNESNVITTSSLDRSLYQIDLRNQKSIQYSFKNQNKGAINDVYSYKGLNGNLLTFNNGEICFQKCGQSNDHKFEFELKPTGIDYTKPLKIKERINSQIFQDYYSDHSYHIYSGSINGFVNFLTYNDKSGKVQNNSFKPLTRHSKLINNIKFDQSTNRLVITNGDGLITVYNNFLNLTT